MKNKISPSYDLLGNIVIVKFSKEVKSSEKKKFADDFLKKHKAIKTVLEKVGKFKGRLRKQETKWIAGEKTKEALYRENDCVFRFNVDTTYFSPRLSNERKEISGLIKKSESVLVMCAGVAPFPVVIARNSKAKEVFSNEINREANKYAKLNIELNKTKDRIFLVPGDIKKVAKKLSSEKKKFDVIVMARPQLKDSFLKEAFSLSKGGRRGTRVFYYDFCKEEGIDSISEKVKMEAKIAKKKIKIFNVKKAGEIGPYRFRVRVDFRVLN